MAFLEIQNIEKRFGLNTVLKDISFGLEKGEVLAISTFWRPPIGARSFWRGRSSLMRRILQRWIKSISA